MNKIISLNWGHLADIKLYSDNQYALETLAAGIDLTKDGLSEREEKKEILNYHCYWYGEIGKKQVFSIKSFLCTQNLDHCKIILWLDSSNGYNSYSKNPHLHDLLPFIEVKKYDPLEEVAGTIWEDHPHLPAQNSDLVARADAFRFVVLYKYGGVYFDLDVMFLKDLGGLANKEFCYAWEFQPYANSAVLRLKKGSPTALYLMKKSIALQTPSPWYVFVYSDLNLSKLTLLPCSFFDPIWMGLPEEKSPFQDFPGFFTDFGPEFSNHLNIRSFREFFPGCYAHHWHNQWKTPETENSFFGMFNNEFYELLKLI